MEVLLEKRERNKMNRQEKILEIKTESPQILTTAKIDILH